MEQRQTDRLIEGHIPEHAVPVDSSNGAAHGPSGPALEQVYAFGDGEVIQYLREFPFLVGLLRDAIPALRQHFPDTIWSLEVVSDPEAADDRQLALVIRSPLSPEILMDKLRKFDAEWWLDRLPRAEDRLFVTLGFA